MSNEYKEFLETKKKTFIESGFDIPMQIALQKELEKHKVPYMAITPLENPPLTQSWAASLMQMGFVFFISETGANAAKKAGLQNADYLRIGVDRESFYPAAEGERELLREGLGYKDEFVILTVADNQERKNLSASIKVVSLLLHPSLTSDEYDRILSAKSDKKVSDFEKVGKFKYVLVTRENTPVGHILRDLAITADINKEFLVIERGISREELRKLYVASDLFLLLSKAEGLGIPILEAMACGAPVMGTDTGAIHELLEDGRGLLVPEAYGLTDVWGNSWRSFANIEHAVAVIRAVVGKVLTCTTHASLWLDEIKLEDTVTKVKEKIDELTK